MLSRFISAFLFQKADAMMFLLQCLNLLISVAKTVDNAVVEVEILK